METVMSIVVIGLIAFITYKAIKKYKSTATPSNNESPIKVQPDKDTDPRQPDGIEKNEKLEEKK